MVRRIARVAAVAAIVVLVAAGCAGKPANSPEGRWQDTNNNVYEIKDAGSGTFTGEVVKVAAKVCPPVHIRVTGSNGHYTGTEAYYSVTGTTCSRTFIGDGGITLAVRADGTSADVTYRPPGAVACVNCAPQVWRKLPGGGGGGVPWWVWLIVAVLVLAVVAFLLRRRRSRRSGGPGGPAVAPAAASAPPGPGVP